MLLTCAECQTTILLATTAQAAGTPFEDVVLVKIGGSSITAKSTKESLNQTALDWFAQTLADTMADEFLAPSEEEAPSCADHDKAPRSAFVIVHGAGSFGHHTAKEYGLQGHVDPPTNDKVDRDLRRTVRGLAATRQSVQKLNQLVVGALLDHGINAIAMSPCFGIDGMQAHGGDERVVDALHRQITSALQVGLVPVLHGDACLYGQGAGILSGDTIMAMISRADWVSRAVFLTDVDGVFTSDPRQDPQARLLREIAVDAATLNLIDSDVIVSGSSHQHDVTGGLKVSLYNGRTSSRFVSEY